ncbi:MAG: tetratricopeptide repeat protein, partial [Pseudomonadota bacterium]
MPTEISNPADTDDAEMIRIPDKLSPEVIDGLLAQAAEAQGQGHLNRAEPVYRAIIAAEKRNADAHNLLGTLLAQRGALEDAVKSIRRAVSITPSFPEAFFNLGIVHRRRGDLDSAIAAYRRATGLREDYADAWNNLGNALADAGRMEEAALSYRRAIAARPGFPEAYGNLAGALVSLGEVDDAISTLRKSLTINPDQIDAILTLGDLQRRTGRYDHAAESFRHILKRSPALVIAHVALIEVLREKARSEAGETDKPDLSAALDAAENLISTHDDIPDGYFHRAIIHAEANDAAAAQTDLETCLRLDPT